VDLRARRRVYIGLAVLIGALFVTGMVAAFLSRNDTICPDRKPPKAESADVGLGKVRYLCHDGTIVTR
jgi:hypothetical protein